MRLITVIVLCSWLAGCAGVTTIGSSDEAAQDAAAQRILVTTLQVSDLAMPQLGDPGAFYLRRRGYGPLPNVNRTLDRIAAEYDIRRVDGWYIASIGQYCEVYELRPGQSVDELIDRIGEDPRVEIVQTMNLFETQGVVYDDPLAAMQPALSTLAIESAHEHATGQGVTVAVIDSTVDRRHQEFRGRVLSQLDLVNRNNTQRAEVHGTAVAGIISSAANNGTGIVGVAPDSGIASLRACWTVDDANGRAVCSSFTLAQAIETAIRLEADVINLSLAGPDDALLSELIDAAIAQDIIVVSALPSESGAEFPASHASVIAVESSERPGASLTPNLVRAPGAEIMSTAPNNSYAFFSGNSMSAAYVAGVSALIRERKPGISAAEVLDVLTRTGTDRSVNACRAIAATGAANTSC
mgnify:CR=1 FL=1